jgi:hypothetical protein
MTEFETSSLELLRSIDARLKSIQETVDGFVNREKKKESNKIEAMNKMLGGFQDKKKK